MRKITVEGFAHLPSLLKNAGIVFDAPCGGKGRCGKCRVKLYGDVSKPSPRELELLSGEELQDGVRLACEAFVEGRATVELPEEKNAQIISDAAPHAAVCPAYKNLGLALDIGTTTLAAELYGEGRLLASATAINPQRSFGADVISRIDSALHGEADKLQRLILDAVTELASELCRKAGRDSGDIDAAVITGNTAMLCLLTNTYTGPLSHAPFEIKEHFGLSIPASRLGLPFAREAEIYLPPCISAFVGADISCALLASGICEAEETALLADIGTNGELALWHGGKLLCCSTAAGPAFEGATLSCGMRGAWGAIDHAGIYDGTLCIGVIGDDADAIGICGSGVVDVIACMLKLGRIDETGRIQNKSERIGLLDAVYLSQKDVRQIQLAKSAVCSGILTLLKRAGLRPEEVSRLSIAGGFGSYLSIKGAADIGLIPQELAPKSRAIGNAALSGAAMLLNNIFLREKAQSLAASATTLSLERDPYFTEAYIDNMMFEV